jgi:hypothetical protein
MNRSRQGLLHALGLACGALVFSLAACVSNPTPHPANDASQETRNDDVGVAAPTDQASCEDLGGFWSGEGCYESDAPDAGLLDVGAPETPDADASEVDGVPGEVDGEVDGTGTSPDGDVGPSD